MPNVFDRLGLAWDPRSPRFAMHLESSISGEALTDYTVRNMGYVAVAAFKRAASSPVGRVFPMLPVAVPPRPFSNSSGRNGRASS